MYLKWSKPDWGLDQELLWSEMTAILTYGTSNYLDQDQYSLESGQIRINMNSLDYNITV